MDLFPMIPITAVARPSMGLLLAIKTPPCWWIELCIQEKKYVQNENASVEQWQIISLPILNKVSVMEIMWTISKRVHEVVF